MNWISRIILIFAVVPVCWGIYAALVVAAGRQRLESGNGYGELYGPLAWLRDSWFWVSVVASALSVAAMPIVLLRRR